MDTSLAHHKPRRLDTSSFLPNCLPSVIALSPSGDHLAVGCSNGDIRIWKLPLGEDTAATHRVTINDEINELQDAGVSSVSWASDTLVTFGRKNGLVTFAKLDYVSSCVSTLLLAPAPHFLAGERKPQCHEYGSGRLPSTDSTHLA